MLTALSRLFYHCKVTFPRNDIHVLTVFQSTAISPSHTLYSNNCYIPFPHTVLISPSHTLCFYPFPIHCAQATVISPSYTHIHMLTRTGIIMKSSNSLSFHCYYSLTNFAAFEFNVVGFLPKLFRPTPPPPPHQNRYIVCL